MLSREIRFCNSGKHFRNWGNCPLCFQSTFVIGKEGLITSVLTPRIGEPIYLNDSTQQFKRWWINEQ